MRSSDEFHVNFRGFMVGVFGFCVGALGRTGIYPGL